MPEEKQFKNPQGIFVTGTNTDIGKTLCCAALMTLLDAHYWKPVQSGPPEDHDAPLVMELSGCGNNDILESCYSFPDPLSPHEAARRMDEHIEFSQINWPENTRKFTIVEGAGGLLVPLNEKYLVIDLIRKLEIPALIVASSELGTINHTLLSLEALRARDIPILGVVMSGPQNEANKNAIETYGKVKVLGEIPFLETISQETLQNILPKILPLAESVGPLRENIKK